MQPSSVHYLAEYCIQSNKKLCEFSIRTSRQPVGRIEVEIHLGPPPASPPSGTGGTWGAVTVRILFWILDGDRTQVPVVVAVIALVLRMVI